MAKGLEDLPQFTVRSIQADGEKVLLKGWFDRIDGVHTDGWDYLYAFGPPYLAAEVVNFDSKSNEADYHVFRDAAAGKDLRPGNVLCWISACWKPAVIDAVLDVQYEWTPQKFVAQDAFSWRQENLRVVAPISQEPPADVTDYTRVEKGWDHDHCGLCNTRISAGDQYYERKQTFICSKCFEKFVRTHDLSFLY